MVNVKVEWQSAAMYTDSCSPPSSYHRIQLSVKPHSQRGNEAWKLMVWTELFDGRKHNGKLLPCNVLSNSLININESACTFPGCTFFLHLLKRSSHWAQSIHSDLLGHCKGTANFFYRSQTDETEKRVCRNTQCGIGMENSEFTLIFHENSA